MHIQTAGKEMKLALHRLVAIHVAVFCCGLASCESTQSNSSERNTQESIDDYELSAKRTILTAAICDLLSDPEHQTTLASCFDQNAAAVILSQNWPTIELKNLKGLKLRFVDFGEAKDQPRRIQVVLRSCRIDLARDKWEENALAFHQCPIQLWIPYQELHKDGTPRSGAINVYYDYIKSEGEWKVRFAGAH